MIQEQKLFFEFNFIIPDDYKSIKYDKNNHYLAMHSTLQKYDLHKTFQGTNVLVLIAKNSQKVYEKSIIIPCSVYDLKENIIKLFSASDFKKNSSINIRNYILDKNKKKITKDTISLDLTEKEIHLIELLYNNDTHLKKNEIISRIWKYSSEANTHTLETHIYRLRKKFKEIFQDQEFINSDEDGYFI